MKLSRFSSDWISIVVIGAGIVAGTGRAMAQRPSGIDVSHFQGSGDTPPTNVDWPTVQSDGISFAWAKAAEGTPSHGYASQDADFAYNEANAKSAGVLIGAYYFAHPETDLGTAGADTAAAHFWSVAGSYITSDGLSLMPVLDYETSPGSWYTTATSSQWVNEWCQDIVNYGASTSLSVKPIIYSDQPFASIWLDTSVTNWAVWMNTGGSGNPLTTGTPSGLTPWSTWNFWQYNQAVISGIEGAVDEDVFNGTAATLLNYVVGGNAAPAGVTLYWDPGASQTSPGSGGTGTWSAATAAWWLSGSSNLAWSASGDIPIFAGSTAGTVTLGAAVKSGNITFNTAGYTIAGTSYTLTLTSSPGTISVPPPGANPTIINCLVSGTGFTVTGGGVLMLNNTANVITGLTSPINIVSNSTVVIATSHALGSGLGGTVNISGGSVLQNNDQTSGDTFFGGGFHIVLGTGGGALSDTTNASLTYTGVISGSGNFSKIGGGGGTGGKLILNGNNTYTGSTTISGGILALGSAGSINSTPSISIAAGATFDVSAIAAYTLSSSTSLSASGTSSPATINGGTTVNLGSQPIALTYDGSHPALTIAQGALSLNGNAFTVNGSQLPVGTYTIIQQASGNIASSGSYSVNGTATGAAGTTAVISVSGGNVNLTIANIIPVTIASITLPGNGTVQMNFIGTPGYAYLIEAATNLMSPITWTNLGTNTADINGLFNFIDTNYINYNYRYYRTQISP